MHHIKKLLRSLAGAGEIGWTPGRVRSITLPDPNDMRPNSELIRTLERRGHIVRILPAGSAPIASVWPEATLVDQPATSEQTAPEFAGDLLDRLRNIG